eukprot:GILJ01006199.1.p1 GENE.GILJ01006199.1~~GILJ01006199.1.p1  ORF type:complete len:496 (-),score=34.93 GILJ01006199.1:217-1704(-)
MAEAGRRCKTPDPARSSRSSSAAGYHTHRRVVTPDLKSPKVAELRRLPTPSTRPSSGVSTTRDFSHADIDYDDPLLTNVESYLSEWARSYREKVEKDLEIERKLIEQNHTFALQQQARIQEQQMRLKYEMELLEAQKAQLEEDRTQLVQVVNHARKLMGVSRKQVISINSVPELEEALFDDTMPTDFGSLEIRNSQRPDVASTCGPLGKMFVFGGADGPEHLRSVDLLDSANGHWAPTVPMIMRRSMCSAAVIDQSIFLCGGVNEKEYFSVVDCYLPAIERWKGCPPMRAPRASLSTVTIDRRVFAVGGYNPKGHLNSVEAYDDRERRWMQCASMTCKRAAAAVCVKNGCIYAIGGTDGSLFKTSVEMYEPRKDVWLSQDWNMSYKRSGGCAISFQNDIIVVGGRTGKKLYHVLQTAERFSFDSKCWMPMAPVWTPRVDFGSCIMNNSIFVVGGRNQQFQSLRAVEWYDVNMDRWCPAPPMPSRRAGCAVAVLHV